MSWVLFWVYITGAGVSTDSADFASQQACEQAKQAVEKLEGTLSTVKATCTPKE